MILGATTVAPAPFRFWHVLAVSAFALAWFQQMGGFQILDPRNIGWMLLGDWHGHLFGWLFTRNGPWTLPLGLAPDLLYPYGSSAAFTDAIPIMSVAAKLFFPPQVLEVQPFGLWLQACVIAQGLVGLWVARKLLPDGVTAVLAAMLFACDPIIVGRHGHPPFFAQFLILGLVGCAFLRADSVHAARRLGALALGFDLFGCAVNAYLGAMCSVLTLTVMVRLALSEGWFKGRERWLWLGSAPAASLFSFWLFGFLAGVKGPMDQLGAEGFGQFSSDLLTFVNPMGWSRFIPSIAHAPRQGEGYAYLGLGVLALLALATARGAKALLAGVEPPKGALRRTLPVLVIALLMMGYALSNHVTLAGKQVLDLSAQYAVLGNLTSVFRSSGRFSWALHCLLTIVAVGAAASLAGRVWAMRAAVGAALLLQVADIDVHKSGFRGPFHPFTPLADPAWKKAQEGYRHIYIHPVMAQWICPYDERVVSLLSYVAYENKMSINSGLVGRNPPEMRSRCLKHLAPQELSPDNIYVVHFPNDYAVDLLNAGYACGVVDGLVTCVADGQDTPMRRAIDQRRIALRPPG